MRRNLPLCAAAVLFCLTLFSTYLVSGLFARYASSAQGSDSARVAKFSIEGQGTLIQSIEAQLAPGEAQENYSLVIHNNSEVTVEYKIEVRNETKNLPLHFSVEEMEEQENGSFTDQKLPGYHTDHYNLRISWPEEENNPDKNMGKVDSITVKVTAAQVD